MSKIDAVVVDAEGLTFSAGLESVKADVGEGVGENQILLHLEDGAQFLVPAELLVPRADGRYDLRLKLREYAAQTDLETDLTTDLAVGSETAGLETEGLEADFQEMTRETAETGDTVIPLVAETFKVGKRTVGKRVQLRKYVTERTETTDVPLSQERLEVERIKVGRPVDEAAPVRYEGDTMIVPLYEEVLVVTKQLMLVEEVRITTQRSERHEQQQVTLRREEVSVERLDDGSTPNE